VGMSFEMASLKIFFLEFYWHGLLWNSQLRLQLPNHLRSSNGMHCRWVPSYALFCCMDTKLFSQSSRVHAPRHAYYTLILNPRGGRFACSSICARARC
jgi:hypothetical protein